MKLFQPRLCSLAMWQVVAVRELQHDSDFTVSFLGFTKG